ncbi:hypothetical protein [Cyanobium sp. ATX-6F1]|uniref:hypothetical protein n=1 Tax=Cyanobium sp. ATX-6F1 TaxID=3137388 RepID=UPI0039BE2171
MKQAVLLGRTAGLRPSVQRRLERLSQRRHPEGGGADLLTLQRLAAESRELELPLSLVVDGRGLGRLLWVGPLEQSGRLLERLPGSQRRQGTDLRLFTCVGRSRQLEPQASEATVGLDLHPLFWLRFSDHAEAGAAGRRRTSPPVAAPASPGSPWPVASWPSSASPGPWGPRSRRPPNQAGASRDRSGCCCWP